MSLDLITAATALSALSGIPGLLFKRSSGYGRALSTALMASASLAGLAGTFMGLFSGKTSQYAFPWPASGYPMQGTDALTLFFLVPVFLIGGLGSVYGIRYWDQRTHPENGRMLQLFWGLMVAGMALLVTATHAMTFLLAGRPWRFPLFFSSPSRTTRPKPERPGLSFSLPPT